MPIVDIAVAGLAACDNIGFIGVAEGSADPGRSGKAFPAIFARFCAAIVSLIEGLVGMELVLREKGSTFAPVADISGASSFCGLGFEGSSIKNFRCFSSRVDDILPYC